MNKYALNDHSVQCPCCLQEYSKLDSPHEYARVLHIVDPCHDQKERVARLSAEILANPGKLPSMSKEEQDELVANLGLDKWYASKADLLPKEQAAIAGYLKAIFPEVKAFSKTTTIMEHIHGEFLKGQQERQYLPTRTPILEQVCIGLQSLDVDCTVHSKPGTIEVKLVEENCSLIFYHGTSTWEGCGYFAPLAHWVSDVPNSCTDVPRITKAIFNWLKRFDYREYRGPAK